jgi:hypothetical protein
LYGDDEYLLIGLIKYQKFLNKISHYIENHSFLKVKDMYGLIRTMSLKGSLTLK